MGKAVLPGQRGESHDEKEGNKNHNGRDLLRKQEVGRGCVVNYARERDIPLFMKGNLKAVWGDDLIQKYPPELL